MKAVALEKVGRPLRLIERERPVPGERDLLLRVEACGVCRTDLHIVDGDLREARLPLIPGHEIVGTVVGRGRSARSPIGVRVGVPWLGGTCGECPHCRAGRENLCDHPVFTGYTRDGGYAEYVAADEHYCFPLPAEGDAVALAPLLCAGLIGYRSYRLAGDDVRRLGIYGFGAAAHIVAQIAHHESREVYAFTRPGDTEAQAFALTLGAVWAGGSDQRPPAELDSAIIFAPVGALVPAALATVRKGGVVVCGGIHMSAIPSFPYNLLWGERVVRSVANLTRADGEGLLAIAPKIPIRTQVEAFALEQANEALERLREGCLRGAAVLRVG